MGEDKLETVNANRQHLLRVLLLGVAGSSLAVQWLGLSTFTSMAPGSIPGPETKILQTVQCGQKNKTKQ